MNGTELDLLLAHSLTTLDAYWFPSFHECSACLVEDHSASHGLQQVTSDSRKKQTHRNWNQQPIPFRGVAFIVETNREGNRQTNSKQDEETAKKKGPNRRFHPQLIGLGLYESMCLKIRPSSNQWNPVRLKGHRVTESSRIHGISLADPAFQIPEERLEHVANVYGINSRFSYNLKLDLQHASAD